MSGTKPYILYVLEILKKHSDEYHPLTAPQINSISKKVFGVEMDRKTIYRNIDILEDFGYEISKNADKRNGYYLVSREFEESEIHLLIDAVYSSKFIPEKATNDLIGKLKSTQSEHFKKRVNNLLVVHPNTKSDNRELFYNIDKIDTAITNKKKISFNYYKYNTDKKLQIRSDKKYVTNPYAVVWANENYYLICCTDPYNNLSHYRIDKIKAIEMLEEDTKKLTDNFNAYEYAKSAIYMYGGEKKSISLMCDMKILDDVIDKFGKNIIILKKDDNTFETTVEASEQGIKFWALQYLNYCKVISPENIRDEIAQIIACGAQKYGNNL